MAEGLEEAIDLPYTISFCVLYRTRIDSFQNLPKDKRPPRDLWDKPFRLTKFLDEVWDKDKEPKTKTEFIEYDEEDAE